MSTDAIICALKARDLKLAQSLLDDVGESLPDPLRIRLQARIHIVSDEPDKAIRVLETFFGEETPTRPVRFLLARAYMSKADPTNALRQIESTDGEIAVKPNLAEATLRIAALATLGLRENAAAAVEEALELYPDSLKVKLISIRALIKVGALDDAARQISAMDESDIPYRVLRDFASCCMIQRRAALVHRLLLRFDHERALRILKFCTDSKMWAGAVQHKANAIASIVDLIDLIETPKLVYYLAISLYKSGLEREADNALARFKYLSQSRGVAPIHPARGPKSAISMGNQLKIAQFMNWLDIPHDQRETWRSKAARGADEKNHLKLLLAASSGYQNEFRRSMGSADLSLLQAIVEQNRPAIMATVHQGFLMGTLLHLASHQLPVFIIGGDPVLKRLMPGGELLNPIQRTESASQIARKVIRHIRARHVVGLAADGSQGTEKYSFSHRGIVFDLPDSIPQMAFRYQIPIIWVVSYWRKNRFVCDCAEGPPPIDGETFEAYRDRWFAFVMDKIYEILREDPRNIHLNTTLASMS